MHLFVTGATGYVGSRLVTALLMRGHRITAMVRHYDAGERLTKIGVETVLGDLARMDAHTPVLQNVDGIVHTAFTHGGDWFEAVEQERKAVSSMIDAIEFRNKLLIITTGTGVLGDTGLTPVSDEFGGQEGFPGRVRLAVEDDVLAAHSQGKLRGIIIRPPLLVHGYGGSQFLPRLVAAARESGVSGYLHDGSNRLSSVHVDDLVDLYVRAVESGSSGQIYNSVGDAIALKHLAEAIAVGNPSTIAKSVSFEEASTAWGEFPAFLLGLNNHPLGDRARSELGWNPYAGTPTLKHDLETGSYAQLLAVSGPSH